MVINITLGPVVRDAACGFAGDDLVVPVCAKAVHSVASVIAAANESADKNLHTRVDKNVEWLPNMRLLWRWLLRAPHLLVCFRRESFGGQSFR